MDPWGGPLGVSWSHCRGHQREIREAERSRHNQRKKSAFLYFVFGFLVFFYFIREFSKSIMTPTMFGLIYKSLRS